MAYAWQTVEQAAVTLEISTRTLARRIAKGEIESRLENGRREVFICLPDEPEPAPQPAAPVASPFATATVADPRNYYAEETRQATLMNGPMSATPMSPVGMSQVGMSQVAMGGGHEPGTALVLAEDRARRAEMAITVIQQSTTMVAAEFKRARSGARWAWGTVAVLAAGVMGAVGWTTAKVTRAQADAEHMNEKITTLVSEKEQSQQQIALSRELESKAREAAARLEGQVAEVQQQVRSAKQEAEAARKEAELARQRQAAAAAAAVPATQPKSLDRVAGGD